VWPLKIENKLKFLFQIHVNLMLLEARVQAELLYALRAIMRHMT
jgi:sestrin 1/3